MGKRSNKAKRSLSSLPKGIARRGGMVGNQQDPGNPFEITARMKRPKQLVHNRPISKPKSTKHVLESLQRRHTQLRNTLQSSKKANQFVDRRIGQYDPTMSQDDQMLARLVKERTRQSQRISKYRLDDDGDDDNGALLTHKGKRLDPNKSEVLYSDDEDDGGNLEAIDTELHFGGSGLTVSNNPYGAGSGTTDLSQLYGQTRKTELDDLIARRKTLKAEKMHAKETQAETFEKMDEEFGELSALLWYRKNEKRPLIPTKPTQEEAEMNEWNVEMRQMMAKPKRQATDRTKKPEEIAKEEAERLHELETRRLARMNGDFEEDDFSDIVIDGRSGKSKKKTTKTTKKKLSDHRNPDELSDSEDEGEQRDGLEMRFTADGLKYIDKAGNVVEKDAKDDTISSGSDGEEEEEGSYFDSEVVAHPLPVGCRVRGNYRAAEQYDGHESWFDGKITKVHIQKDGSVKYDVEYDDGDFEVGMIPKNIRPIKKTPEEEEDAKKKKETDDEIQLKRKLAKEKARKEIPFVFEAPTTLEGLHELIAKYASTGRDASTIIQRIHTSNSVRLDHRNGEKMQNFYDVLLRRFIAVGDAIFESGDGGKDLGRAEQLDNILKTLYAMAQDAPETAGAVWGRRIGILHNAHGKRLRDSEFVHEDEEEFWTAWPSTGVFLLLRALGHIFPVTDRRHYVVTPAILLLTEITAHTPILSRYDVVMGVLCSGLLLEYTKEAKRVVPEALSFIASTIRLFSSDPGRFTNPALEAAHKLPFSQCLRKDLNGSKSRKTDPVPMLSLEKNIIEDSSASDYSAAVLSTCMTLIEKCTTTFKAAFPAASEQELLYDVSSSMLTLRPKSFSSELQKKVSTTVSLIAEVCSSERAPLQRRGRASAGEMAIKTLAPRMEDPTRYSMSRDKGKKSVQAAIDRTRREYKREHKAITRELRMDGAFIETERRKEQAVKENKARAKRQKNFAWLEGEQASMNQQVRQGGGLIKGGGTGLARAKVATGKMGIKKGGRF
ncbi:Nop14-like family protein [Nitzschia inconspicua]|uniref:Nop14-like family protein n=1 Tax=Nitzschia inconspicua TaxID=303405 RepID=A0A9K3KQQ5_9STRA|nr:Nop14-like family protein [Nitzschia inconspicua]